MNLPSSSGFDATPHSSTPHPAVVRRRIVHPTTAVVLLVAALAAFSGWWAADRPVVPPDYTGAVGGLSFSPFHRGESPQAEIFPSRSEMKADLERAADVTNRIRTYTVAGVFADIPHLARDLPLRITLGAWLDTRIDNDGREMDRLIATARASSNVERVLVGNEVLHRHDLTPDQLVGYITRARRALRVPVSTAEPWYIWEGHPELVEAVDYIAVHLLPYWEQVPASEAVAYSLRRLDELHALYPSKHIVVGEIGWPSDGVDIGAARASRDNQALFMRSLFVQARERGLDYFVMEAFDQPWKTSFEGRAAGYWGMMDLDRRAKWPMIGPVEEVPSWPLWAAASIAAATLLAGGLLSRRPDIRAVGKLLLAGLVQGLCATLAGVLLAMSGKYLSVPAAATWGALIGGQLLLLTALLADSFELAETVWGRAWRRRPVIVPAGPDAVLPKVSIHVPMCNEPPDMVRRTLDALACLDYPDFEVLVIDNNTADPALWEPVAEHCARLGPRFRFYHLGRWPGFKGGALNFARRKMAPEAAIVGVLDSDYVVRPDWLRCMVPQFARPEVGLVQSPQDYRDNDGSLFKRLMFWEYAGFFQLGMITRNERNAIIQHGTMTLIRAHALHDAGGWAEWCICEDAELGLKLLRRGWEAVYSERSFGRGVMPDDFDAYRRQRSRWAYGAMQICRRNADALLSPFNRALTAGQRWHFLTGWLPWVGDALGLAFLGVALVWSALLIAWPGRFEFPIVLFLLPSIGLFAFKLTQIVTLYRARVACGALDRLGAAIAGLALSYSIGKAVWRGLLTRRAPFHRTPKMACAPAAVQGLMMAREELLVLALTLTALAGVWAKHRFATWEATLWCGVLLTQAVPYAASVLLAVLAALPHRHRAVTPAQATAAVAGYPELADPDTVAGGVIAVVAGRGIGIS